MTFIDRIFLMWWSTDATAAAYPAALLWWTILCLPLGICGYVTTFVAQYEGAGWRQRVGSAVWQGAWTALVWSPPVLATAIVAPWVFRVVGHPEAVQVEEVTYYQLLSLAGPAMLLSSTLSSFFSGTRRTRVVMAMDVASTVLNVVLDYLWIFGVAGFPAAGIAGAAWATVVSTWARAAGYFYLFLRPKEKQSYATYNWTWEGGLFARLWYYGVPSGLQIFLEVVGFTVFVLLIGRLGTHQLAASNLAFNVSSFAFMPVYGFAQAGAIVLGRYLGRNEPSHAARGAWSAAGYAVSYMGVISSLYVLVPDVFLFGYFYFDGGENLAIYSTALILLRYVAAYNVFDALNMVFSYAVKGAGDTYYVFYASVIMALILALSTWYLVDFRSADIYECWGVLTVWTCVLGIIYFVRFRSGYWKFMRVTEIAIPGEAG